MLFKEFRELVDVVSVHNHPKVLPNVLDKQAWVLSIDAARAQGAIP